MNQRIIIATPHIRYDNLELKIRERLSDYEVIRIRFREELLVDRLKELKPEFIFFPHWSWLIPEEIFSQYECVIFHMTDLPYGRGGSPLQNLIVRGHTETRLSAIRCEIGLDSGPIYEKKHLSLIGTAEEILLRASQLMEDMIISIVRNHPVPVQQTGNPVFFSRRNPDDGNLENVDTLREVYNYIRMLDAEGYPHAFIETDTFRFEFLEAKFSDSLVSAKVIIKRKEHE
jgi:methionyl-tRNA formyltransferase